LDRLIILTVSLHTVYIATTRAVSCATSPCFSTELDLPTSVLLHELVAVPSRARQVPARGRAIVFVFSRRVRLCLDGGPPSGALRVERRRYSLEERNVRTCVESQISFPAKNDIGQLHQHILDQYLPKLEMLSRILHDCFIVHVRHMCYY